MKYWLVAMIIGMAIPTLGHGQSRILLGREGSTNVFLLPDSTDYENVPVLRFTTISVDATGQPSGPRRHEIHCTTLRHRPMIFGQWAAGETVADSVWVTARNKVCEFLRPDRWTYMFSVRNGEYLVDRATVDSIPGVRNGRRAWLKLDYDTAVNVVGTSRKSHENMGRYDFDCSQRRMRTLMQVDYDSIGSVVDRFEVPLDSAKWSMIIPESHGENMSTWICTSLPKVDRIFPIQRR